MWKRLSLLGLSLASAGLSSYVAYRELQRYQEATAPSPTREQFSFIVDKQGTLRMRNTRLSQREGYIASLAKQGYLSTN